MTNLTASNSDAAALATHFDHDSIRALVHTFYAGVRDDAELAPVFDRRISDWPHHLERMVQFWTTILTDQRVFRPRPEGGPPVLHRNIEELTQAHFDRWIALWGATAHQLFVPELAVHLHETSKRMRMTLGAHLPS